MESWRSVWRKGICPLLSEKSLLELKGALEEDSPSLIQGATTSPSPLSWAQDLPVEAACALAWCGWKGEELEKVGEVEEYFSEICFEVDQRLGGPAECRWFLNTWDEEPREEIFAKVLQEVEYELAKRKDDGTARDPLDPWEGGSGLSRGLPEGDAA